MQIEIQNTVDDETAAAIMAAVAAVLAAPHPIPSATMPPRSAWARAGIRENHVRSDGALERWSSGAVERWSDEAMKQ